MSRSSTFNRRALFKSAGALGLTSLIPQSAFGQNATPPLSKGFVDTSFGYVFYQSFGEGPDVICIHQSAQSAAEYAQFAPLLAKSFKVTVIDLPGHGHSDTPPKELTMQEYSDAIIAVMNHLKISSTHVVGNHGGAALTVDLAHRYPSRINRIVAVGLGRGETLDLDALKDQPMTRDLPIDADGDFLDKTWQVYRKMSAKQTPPETTYQPFLVSLQQRQRPYDMHHAAYRWDYYPLVPKVTHTALLMKATEDPFAGDTESLSKMFANGSYASIEGGGVWLFYEQPEKCADKISTFLKQ